MLPAHAAIEPESATRGRKGALVAALPPPSGADKTRADASLPQLRPRPRRHPAGDDRPRLRRQRRRLGADLDRQDPGHLHRLGQRVGAALDAGPGQRLGHRRVRDAAGLDRRPQAARHLEGQAGRPRGRDPAPDRPLAAGRRRLQGARRTQRLRRLRRARSRRRHPLRGDHRRLRRAAPGLPEAARQEGDRDDAADRLGRRGQRRHGRRPRRSATSTTPRTRPPRSTPTSS